ncbi:hypothetical protein CR205_03340 [Alteribacter lacisalsi]|uniref:Lon proteolytic domain-containing protein n=1 Tax=Alteribacter lacisalsi TaxID=2045244 RepID=A0A2W0HKL8_9BACI|nr:S16 family serine protease [Alteribacter lacisalsi]PYZ97642.1 hypothetical protein CR205_03340 [Alteribacter lacisalsi]
MPIAAGFIAGAIMYLSLFMLYINDVMNGFIFIGLLLIFCFFTVILFFFLRKRKRQTRFFTSALSVLLILLAFDFQLLEYESATYTATGYMEPIDLLEDSGLYLLPVRIEPVAFIEDKEWLMEGFEAQNIDIYHIEPITNQDRYVSKNRWLAAFAGFTRDGMTEMEENLTSYGYSGLAFAEDFFELDNLKGNSAGLALGLKAMYDRGELQNAVPIGITGAIERDGTVSAVGGIREKLLTSEAEGFSHVILPELNFAEAHAAKQNESLDVEIHGVRDIEHAADVIRELNGSR